MTYLVALERENKKNRIVKSFLIKHQLLLKSISFLLGALLLYTYIQYTWWWIASYSAFFKWYDNFGAIIWIAKMVVPMLWLVSAVSIFKKELKKYPLLVFKSYPIFIFYVVLALILKTQHPFSNLAVYDSLPNHSYVFLIEDEAGKIFNHEITYKSADIIDFYDTYLEKHNISEPLSDAQLNKIGEEIMRNQRAKNQFTKKKCFKVIRLKNLIANDSLKTIKTILYEERN